MTEFDVIKMAKDMCQEHILKHYPLWRQNNINELQGGHVVLDKTTMWTFINACRSRCDEYESQENLSTSDINYTDISP